MLERSGNRSVYGDLGATFTPQGVALNPVLAGLAEQVAADHPTMKLLRIRPSPSGAEAVQLEVGLKAEAVTGVRTLKPEAGKGYRLVLDITPHAAAAPSPPADTSAAAPRLTQPLAATASLAVPAGGQRCGALMT